MVIIESSFENQIAQSIGLIVATRIEINNIPIRIYFSSSFRSTFSSQTLLDYVVA